MSPLVPLIWYPTSSLNMFIDPHIAAMCIGYLPCLPGAGTSRLTPHSFIKYLAIAHLMDLLVPTVNGVVWCGAVWCGVVRCGVVWCGVVWCGVVWCGVVWCGAV